MQIKQSYHAKVELEAFMERHGIVDANRANDVLNVDQQEEYATLCSEVKHEQKRNAEDMQIYFGREVPHSMPVQLLHVKSQKVILVASPSYKKYLFSGCFELTLDSLYTVPQSVP